MLVIEGAVIMNSTTGEFIGFNGPYVRITNYLAKRLNFT